MGGYITLSKHISLNENPGVINCEVFDPRELVRSFYPISRIDQLGSFDLLVKVLKNDSTGEYLGKFSEIIENCPLGENFQLVAQDYRYKYNGFGEIEVKHSDGSTSAAKDIRSLVMLAQNTNISTFFQLVDTVARYGLDPINLSLLYSVNDMVYSSGSRSVYRRTRGSERGREDQF